MAEDEQTLIERYFRHLGAVRTDVVLGIGDDAALLRALPGHELVQTTDVLVEQVHFLPGSPPRSLGHRALAINLSDLAAMGASPAWALLSLTLPQIDESWLGEFAVGFGLLARTHQVALVGGNLSRGPLTATVQLTGQVADGTALRRSGARPGDEIWVSGTLGDASVGRRLPSGAAASGHASWLRARSEYPTPRVALGEALRGIASACIDLSDGLLADLPRLCAASGCGAWLDVERLPLSTALRAHSGASAWEYALAGGEDYELCVTTSPARAGKLEAVAAQQGVALTRCGQLREIPDLELRRGADVIQFSQSRFDHFAR
ncbi:MAG TPA: thiamine-phosphate kinase [Steroidobacteraceae bacterium]|nr:thiamine-phosphate kinase [Steroidobacteraceae bacterium]